MAVSAEIMIFSQKIPWNRSFVNAMRTLYVVIDFTEFFFQIIRRHCTVLPDFSKPELCGKLWVGFILSNFF